MVDVQRVKPAIEAMLFLCGDGLEPTCIADVLGIDVQKVYNALQCLSEEYSNPSRGVVLLNIGNKYQIRTKPEYESYILKIVPLKHNQNLSQAALETLSVIAHYQPITRMKIEHIRGVNSDSSISKLLERGMIEECGKMDTPGRPVLYKTTEDFLNSFGLSSSSELIEEASETLL